MRFVDGFRIAWITSRSSFVEGFVSHGLMRERKRKVEGGTLEDEQPLNIFTNVARDRVIGTNISITHPLSNLTTLLSSS